MFSKTCVSEQLAKPVTISARELTSNTCCVRRLDSLACDRRDGGFRMSYIILLILLRHARAAARWSPSGQGPHLVVGGGEGAENERLIVPTWAPLKGAVQAAKTRPWQLLPFFLAPHFPALIT